LLQPVSVTGTGSKPKGTLLEVSVGKNACFRFGDFPVLICIAFDYGSVEAHSLACDDALLMFKDDGDFNIGGALAATVYLAQRFIENPPGGLIFEFHFDAGRIVVNGAFVMNAARENNSAKDQHARKSP
jgi:hypothetical protein